jgi:hypothetical protein
MINWKFIIINYLKKRYNAIIQTKTLNAPCHICSNDIDKILLEHNFLGYQANPL